MIIYENELSGFIADCDRALIANKIAEKMHVLGVGHGASEERSWAQSLPEVALALNDEAIPRDLNVAVEYRSTLGKNRVDFIIYGLDETERGSLVIVELKQWSTVNSTRKPNYIYAVGYHAIEDDYQHPSYQSLRYKCIFEAFNEYVQEHHVLINSCSYCHNLDRLYSTIISSLSAYPFIEQSPVYLKDEKEKLREFVARYIKKGCRELLYEIDGARIRPSKDFAKLLADAIQGQPIFTLDDNQAASVATIVHAVETAIMTDRRKTIIIRGGPGTGKSIVAINALGLLVHPNDGRPIRNACYCTANFTPKTLFSHLLEQNDFRKAAISNLFKSLAAFSHAAECDYDCVFFDEAHRVFQWRFGQGVKRDVDMFDRAFKASLVNVWFIDEDQAVTRDDFVSIARIREYARRWDSEIIETPELTLSSQFRCTGGQRYIDLIERFLGYVEAPGARPIELRNYEFAVFDTAEEVCAWIKDKQREHTDARLLAGYTHPWLSERDKEAVDIVLDQGRVRLQWNKKTAEPYILDESQLDRVGCIHTIQGVDMSYAGVIIGTDLIYRDGRIVFDGTWNLDPQVPASDPVLSEKLIRNTYKVLLTRAIYGTCVYCEDKALAEYLRSLVHSSEDASVHEKKA